MPDRHLHWKDRPFFGATATGPGVPGLVPPPAAGDEAKVLLGSGVWGTSSSSGAVAAFWAKVDNATRLSIPSAGAALVNRMHKVTGTAGNYDITMPTAGLTTGDVCGFIVSDFSAANKVYRLDAGVGVLICGRTRYLSLIHSNVALFYWDGTGWEPLVLCLDTPWVDAGVISITGSTSNPSKGTTTADKMVWRRVGACMHIIWHYNQTVAGTAGSGTYILGLPLGAAVNTTITGTAPDSDNFDIRAAKSGFGTVQLTNVSNAASHGVLFARSSTGTGIGATVVNTTGAVSYLWQSTQFQLSSTAIAFVAEAQIPITDW